VSNRSHPTSRPAPTSAGGALPPGAAHDAPGDRPRPRCGQRRSSPCAMTCGGQMARHPGARGNMAGGQAIVQWIADRQPDPHLSGSTDSTVTSRSLHGIRTRTRISSQGTKGHHGGAVSTSAGCDCPGNALSRSLAADGRIPRARPLTVETGMGA
jgi:hypothetical protein